MAFIAVVNTPMGDDGSADLKVVLQVAQREIGQHMNNIPFRLLCKSTFVPVGTAEIKYLLLIAKGIDQTTG